LQEVTQVSRIKPDSIQASQPFSIEGTSRMTRSDTLLHLLRLADKNGFEFRSWFEANIASEWRGTEDAVRLLTTDGRFNALIFSHDFARALWKRGEQMNFTVPELSYSRTNGKGEVITINRKAFTRRTIKADVWKYHLREMAVSEDPIQYLKRFLPLQMLHPARTDELHGLPVAG
jgi:hypothetical protein